MPTARRIEIPHSGVYQSFRGDKYSTSIDKVAVATDVGRNNGDNTRTRGNDVFVAERRHQDRAQTESHDDPKEADMGRDDQVQCSEENAKTLQNQNATQKQSQELQLQPNESRVGQHPYQSLLQSRSSSKYEEHARHLHHGDEKFSEGNTDMRDMNHTSCLSNQNRHQQQADAPIPFASEQSTAICQSPRDAQPRKNSPGYDLHRNYLLLEQEKPLSRENQTAPQMRQEECDLDFSQSTHQHSTKPNIILQQNAQSEHQQQFRNGQENQEVSEVHPSPEEHHIIQHRSQLECQQQLHRDEVFVQSAQQIQNIDYSLNNPPQRQQNHQQQQPCSSKPTKRLGTNGFSPDGVPPQVYRDHHDIHHFNLKRNNSSSAQSYQDNDSYQENQRHGLMALQNITKHATWQCTICHQIHPSFIRTCPCVYGSTSHSDQINKQNEVWQKRAPYRLPGQQQQQPLHYQNNDGARSTVSNFQPPTHYQNPLVPNSVLKSQQQHNYYPDKHRFDNRETSTASNFEALVREYDQKPMVLNTLPRTTSLLQNSESHVTDQSSLVNDDEPRHRTKKVVDRQFRNESGTNIIDLTARHEDEGKNESKYFNSINSRQPQATFSRRIIFQPNLDAETSINQNGGRNDYHKNMQSLSVYEATISAHNSTHVVNHAHDNDGDKNKRIPKSLTQAIDKVTSLPQLEGLRHHIKMMLEKVEDKINCALFDKAMRELDSTDEYAATNQLSSDDEMACVASENCPQRQDCCPICFSFEDRSKMSLFLQKRCFTCPICEEPNICQNCQSKCNVCKRDCCFDCMKSCESCALLYCFDCRGNGSSGATHESTPTKVMVKEMCGKCIVNAMSDTWTKNAGVKARISNSKSGLKRKRSNETATQEKCLKTSPRKNVTSSQNITKQPPPTQKTSKLSGSTSEISNEPSSQHSHYAVRHKFIIQHEGKLGIHITADPKNAMRTIISRVDRGSPADIYGLKAGDRIVYNDDNPNDERTYTLTREWLIDRLKTRPTSLSVFRRLGEDSERHFIYALDTAGEKILLNFEESDFCASIHRFFFSDDRDLGMSIGEWNTRKGYSCTVVEKVESGSLAEIHGIHKGDIISKITEDGRLLTGLSQWIGRIMGNPPFSFEVVRLHKIKINQQSRNKRLESQHQLVDRTKVNILRSESNKAQEQNESIQAQQQNASAAEEANSDHAAAYHLSNDSKIVQKNASDLPENSISESTSTKTAQNSLASEKTNEHCSEVPVNEMIRHIDPLLPDQKPRNPTHCAIESGNELDSNNPTASSPRETTKGIISVVNTKASQSCQADQNDLVHKSQPAYRIGTKLWKKFLDDHGKKRPFEGRIESYDPIEGFYKIVYEDGDEEELTERQVSKLVQKNQKVIDKNRPLLIGKLSLIEKDGKYLHSIRGHWHFEKHPFVPSQTFELLSKDSSDKVFSTEKVMAADGEYYGSFVYEWKDSNTKEMFTAVIKESNVVLDFAKEGQEGEVFMIKGKGINQYGIFELNGLASKDTKSNNSVYDIRMHKTYLNPNTAN